MFLVLLLRVQAGVVGKELAMAEQLKVLVGSNLDKAHVDPARNSVLWEDRSNRESSPNWTSISLK